MQWKENLHLSLLHLYCTQFIASDICVSVCVCERERERETAVQ